MRLIFKINMRFILNWGKATQAAGSAVSPRQTQPYRGCTATYQNYAVRVRPRGTVRIGGPFEQRRRTKMPTPVVAITYTDTPTARGQAAKVGDAADMVIDFKLLEVCGIKDFIDGFTAVVIKNDDDRS